jgi:DnaJ-class molecular chaperone
MRNDELAEYGLKYCPDCDGDGLQGGGEDCNFITECSTCEGSGYVPYTEDDALNDKENELIGNDEMMKDI